MDFSIELYREHLEEASFLYEQRGALFHDPELLWPDLNDFEERFARHIDALEDRSETALQVCRQQTVEGDTGELHAAVRVFCRHKRLDLIREIFSCLDASDDARVAAVADGLKHEWPPAWTGEIAALWSAMPGPCMATLPQVIGFQRLATMDQVLIAALSEAPAACRYALVRSLGRIKSRSAVPVLAELSTQCDTDFSSAAILALLRIGEILPADRDLETGVPGDFKDLLRFSLAGDHRHIDFLLGQLNDPSLAAETAIALGVLGDTKAVEPLMQWIDDPAAGESAALALDLITGAGLLQEVFVPEEINPDELFDEELERWKKGEPLFAPGQQPGTTFLRVSQDKAAWHAWWRGNQRRFQAGVRYRNGHPYSPSQLLENLKNPRSPAFLRQIAYEELVVRYGIDAPFETDMTVSDQLKALEALEVQIGQGAHRFKEGFWYFAGRVTG